MSRHVSTVIALFNLYISDDDIHNFFINVKLTRKHTQIRSIRIKKKKIKLKLTIGLLSRPVRRFASKFGFPGFVENFSFFQLVKINVRSCI